jgi:hypothetical protein
VTAPDPTKEIKITNSTQAPISILLPTTSSQSADANGTMVYGEGLEMIESVDGVTAVPAGATKTFILEQTYIDPDTNQSEYSTIYDLLPSTSDWLMPVGNIGVMQSFDDPPSYPAQTVTAADATAFKNAANFVQSISAYPTSALATGYQAAVNSASNNAPGQADGSSGSGDAVAQSIDDTVNAYFQTTKTYQNVTLAAVIAIQSYYGSFPFVWAEFAAAGTTYYLYSSNGTATSFVGTVSLKPPARVDIAKANGGYTCTFTPASNGSDTSNVNVNAAGAKSLTYTQGNFVDDVTSDLPQVAMKGTFQRKGLFTNNSADTQIIPVLTGVVNGQTSLGFDAPQLSTDTSSTFWDSLFNPKNSAQVFQSVMTIGGALMMLVFVGQTLYGMYQWARNLGAAKEPTTAEAVRAELQAFREDMLKATQEQVKKVSHGQNEAPTTEEEASTSIKTESDVIVGSQQRAALTDGFNAQAKNVQELATFEPEMNATQIRSLQSNASAIRSSVSELNSSTASNVGEVVAEQAPKLTSTTSSLTTLTEGVSKSVNSATKSAIQENTELSTKAVEQVEDLTETSEKIPTEDPEPSEFIGDI